MTPTDKEPIMAMAVRTAKVEWQGNLAGGRGTVSLNSGALADFPVTWASRTERSNGVTSPEELVAAAHASCYSMALTHGLSEAGTPPTSLEVSATATLDVTDEGLRITTIELEVRGRVVGIDAGDFAAAAEGAKNGCPVSNALTGVDIRLVGAHLEA